MLSNSERASDQKVDEGKSAAPGSRKYRNQAPEERRRERRMRLIEAGLDEFTRKGYHASTIDGLCARAAVSTRNFYEEFANKEALIIELYDEVNQKALTAAGEALAAHESGTLVERVHAGFSAYLAAMMSDRRWARVAYIESVSVSPAVEAHRRATLEAFQELIRSEGAKLVEDGAIPERDLTLTAVAVVGAVRELAIHVITAEIDDVEPVVAEATRLITNALVSAP